jgi:CheY-like chemotaxis protein
LRDGRPDVLVSDLGLPGADGYALIREMRTTPALRAVPAIAVTGVTEDDAQRAVAAGYQVRLQKPVDPDLLVTAVAQLSARSPAAR